MNISYCDGRWKSQF